MNVHHQEPLTTRSMRARCRYRGFLGRGGEGGIDWIRAGKKVFDYAWAFMAVVRGGWSPPAQRAGSPCRDGRAIRCAKFMIRRMGIRLRPSTITKFTYAELLARGADARGHHAGFRRRRRPGHPLMPMVAGGDGSRCWPARGWRRAITGVRVRRLCAEETGHPHRRQPKPK